MSFFGFSAFLTPDSAFLSDFDGLASVSFRVCERGRDLLSWVDGLVTLSLDLLVTFLDFSCGFFDESSRIFVVFVELETGRSFSATIILNFLVGGDTTSLTQSLPGWARFCFALSIPTSAAFLYFGSFLWTGRAKSLCKSCSGFARWVLFLRFGCDSSQKNRASSLVVFILFDLLDIRIFLETKVELKVAGGCIDIRSISVRSSSYLLFRYLFIFIPTKIFIILYL